MRYVKLFENMNDVRNGKTDKYWKVKCDFGGETPELEISLKKLKVSKEKRAELEDSMYEIGKSEPYVYIMYLDNEWNWTWIETDDYANIYKNLASIHDELEKMKYMGELDITEEIEKWNMKQAAKKYNL